ncbi:MAG TPA: hypothetical protein VER03_12470 [Bryobacteraceae bacterium]|nr:hypothetical protein [Bryobacteraceae bacterium]
MAKKDDRCWPGYEPVPGKAANEQGSCRKKAASKSTDSEKKFQAKREKQLQEWKKEHPKSPRKSAQHLSKPATAAKKKRAPSTRKKARRTTK